MSDRLWQQLRRLIRWLSHVAALDGLPPWQLRLELLLTQIPAAARGRVAANLQLPQTSVARLAAFATAEATVLDQVPTCDRPSACVQCLQAYDTETLLLLAVRHPRSLGDRIWRYLTHWSQVKAPLNGHHLRQMGYRPGPRYRDILEDLKAATLDGTIADPEAAVAFVRDRYPLPPSP
jgi:tRNA nucleotidyltransferase (CCA-adding enzyme)